MNATATQRPSDSLLERLDQGPVICAEGYVFELERRGYLQAGAFVPEVVLEHPEVVAQLHRDFVHAGSDVVEALTYYAHREKLRIIGREKDLEPINRRALDIAKTVAAETGAFFAGDICNTNVYDPGRPGVAQGGARDVRGAGRLGGRAGVDFVIGETFFLCAGSADRARRGQARRTDGGDHAGDASGRRDARELGRRRCVQASCRRRRRRRRSELHPWSGDDDAAAARDPRRCQNAYRGAAVPYRTSEREPSFQSLRDAHWHYDEGSRPFPVALDPFTCNRFEIAEFGREALALRSAISACAAAPGRTISARWPRPSASVRPPANTRPTCRSTRSWARTSDQEGAERTTRTSFSDPVSGRARPAPRRARRSACGRKRRDSSG
jgi:Methionine synthase I (cobalamin-dependent), methyltransferase domain